MGTALSGLASGFDWQSMVSKLMSVEAVPQNNLKTETGKLNNKLTALTRVKTAMEALQTASKTLASQTSDYYTRTTSLAKDGTSSTSNMTASADGTTPVGSYKFDIIQKATSTVVTGAKAGKAITDASQTLAALNVTTSLTAGKFTVNGKTVTIATTDTLQSVFDKINTATTGEVTAALVNDKVVLTGHDLTSSGTQPRITLGASTDDSNFLSVMKLYTDTTTTPATTVSSASALGATNVNGVISTVMDTSTLTGLTAGKGSFFINGKEITFDIANTSLRALMSEVNTAGTGVVMNYDPGTDNFTITNNSTGSSGVVISDPNGLLAKMGLTSAAGAATTYGVNAQFKLNGSSTVISSASNKLTETSHGIPGLEITIKDTGVDTVTTAVDTSTAKKNIETFVSAYNNFNDLVDSLTEITKNEDNSVTTATLSSNHEVQGWLTSLRSMLFNTVSTGVSSVSRFDHLGYDIDYETGEIEVKDSTALTEALADNPNAVSLMFNDTTSGIAAKMKEFITKTLDTNGSYQTQVNSINKQTTSLKAQITAWDTKLANEEERLTNSFVNMETMQAKLQQQLKSLTAAFGS